MHTHTHIRSETTALVGWGACVWLQSILSLIGRILNPEEL